MIPDVAQLALSNGRSRSAAGDLRHNTKQTSSITCICHVLFKRLVESNGEQKCS